MVLPLCAKQIPPASRFQRLSYGSTARHPAICLQQARKIEGFAAARSAPNLAPMNQRQLDEYLAYLRFPSVSTDPTRKGDVAACADWILAKLTAIGLKATLHPTAGHPIVIAKNEHKPGRRTVMIYGHYDVQPVDPLGLWESPPFEPRIAIEYVCARSTTPMPPRAISPSGM